MTAAPPARSGGMDQRPEPCDAPGAFDVPRTPEWELFDLARDPHELPSVYTDPAYRDVVAKRRTELRRLQDELGDTECAPVPDR